jgi:hypothetical protein
MAISPEDAQREQTERRRRLGLLRARAAREGATTPPEVLTEITDLERVLTDAYALWTDQDDAMPMEPVTRHEFNALSTQVSRITLVLMISSFALVLSLAAFIMALIVLVVR